MYFVVVKTRQLNNVAINQSINKSFNQSFRNTTGPLKERPVNKCVVICTNWDRSHLLLYSDYAVMVFLLCAWTFTCFMGSHITHIHVLPFLAVWGEPGVGGCHDRVRKQRVVGAYTSLLRPCKSRTIPPNKRARPQPLELLEPSAPHLNYCSKFLKGEEAVHIGHVTHRLLRQASHTHGAAGKEDRNRKSIIREEGLCGT